LSGFDPRARNVGCDRISLMHAERVPACVSPQKLIAAYLERFEGALLSSNRNTQLPHGYDILSRRSPVLPLGSRTSARGFLQSKSLARA
jgi:hypothetical protein